MFKQCDMLKSEVNSFFSLASVLRERDKKINYCNKLTDWNIQRQVEKIEQKTMNKMINKYKERRKRKTLELKMCQRSAQYGVAFIVFFLKNGSFQASVLLFPSFKQSTVNMFIITFCHWLNSNLGPLALVGTGLPNEPLPQRWCHVPCLLNKMNL